jgi:bifunctional DNase/RNase
MELYSAEVQNLKKLLEVWIADSNQEMEATFGLQVPINITTSLAVAQASTSQGFQSSSKTIIDLLSARLEHFRFSIVGPGDIQEYCS